MIRYVFVKNGVVENVTRQSEQSPLSPPWYPSEVAQIGWVYNNGQFYEPAPSTTTRNLPIADFMMRFPEDVPGRAYALMQTNPRLAASWQMLFTQREINLDHPLLIRELNYFSTLSDAQGPLLSESERAALTA